MAAKQSTAPASSPSPGPRQKVHIRVTYMGKGPPSPILRGKCDRVEEFLEGGDAGTISKDSSAGDGAVDIYVITRAPPKAMAEAWEIVNHLGLSSRTTIKIVDPKTES